ncbi:MAG: helicase-related protein [bacterium]
MPRIFDNIDLEFLPALRQSLELSKYSDFCVGYFNLRGWKTIDTLIETWDGGEGKQCRLLVGMQKPPHEQLRQLYRLLPQDDIISNQVIIRLKNKLADDFRNQLTLGAPTDEDEAGLRRLASQLKAGKVVVKLFLKHPLHAKLYLCFRQDPINPIIGYLGSSNLTLAGLSHQGELNVDVLDHDAAKKLSKWFNDRWNDRLCVDITNELIKVIEESWAREETLAPYCIYIKMAYHLAEEARAGLSEFEIPRDMRPTLLEFQSAAVRIAARHLEKRGGVILGDVVGLGKTLMATTLARVFQEPPHQIETLILCPKNLVPMWEGYVYRYRLIAKVVSITQVENILPELRRYRLVIIDESHNLRNREGRRWAVIRDYIEKNASKSILLSATPYNKVYLDLANQLRLFLNADDTVGIRPEEYLRRDCNSRVDEFTRRHQCPVNSLSAFEKSEYSNDWRELMRLFMVRRTRSFVERNYAYTECPSCSTILTPTQNNCPKCGRIKSKDDKRFLILEGNARFYFPKRSPRTLSFDCKDKDINDQFACLYSDKVVNIIRDLHLPRYGLGNYLKPTPDSPPTQEEDKVIRNLSRAGKRLIGFCRTNLFKRLESSGSSFLLSVRRHILRNYIYLYAIKNGLLPIGTQDSALFDARNDERDSEDSLFETEQEDANRLNEITANSLDEFAQVAESNYKLLETRYWLRTNLFIDDLARHLKEDANRLFEILRLAGEWQPEKDNKLKALSNLLTQMHPDEKALVFSQFSDTVEYLNEQLQRLGIKRIAAVTGDTEDPSRYVKKFSPVSNDARNEIPSSEELRVLITTDVLSEGQNLQDAHIIVNYDLPWAIIRLIQRAGRVDRIGQKAGEVLCYTFLPAEGVERLISLRSRVRQRLQENAEVIGTDEAFFEDEKYDNIIRDLFTERANILNDPEDEDVDLASLAYQIWKNACDVNPELKKIISDLPNVVFSTKPLSDDKLSGVMVYVRTADGNDALTWLDEDGNVVTESQHEILTAAACEPDTPPLQRLENHHRLVQKAVESIQKEHPLTGGQLGKPSSARRRAYEKLKDYAEKIIGTLFDVQLLHSAIGAIYEQSLTEYAKDIINRELRTGISAEKFAELTISLYEDGRLCVPKEETGANEPQIICSLGIRRE